MGASPMSKPLDPSYSAIKIQRQSKCTLLPPSLYKRLGRSREWSKERDGRKTEFTYRSNMFLMRLYTDILVSCTFSVCLCLFLY